jgi:hypothetical protein
MTKTKTWIMCFWWCLCWPQSENTIWFHFFNESSHLKIDTNWPFHLPFGMFEVWSGKVVWRLLQYHISLFQIASIRCEEGLLFGVQVRVTNLMPQNTGKRTIKPSTATWKASPGNTILSLVMSHLKALPWLSIHDFDCLATKQTKNSYTKGGLPSGLPPHVV